MPNKETYSEMQKTKYELKAERWQLHGPHRNAVTGGFDEHNNWEDYNLLHKGIDTKNLTMLDFACGPGRNIVKFWKAFERVDGVDIGTVNIKNAKIWMEHNGISESENNMYVNNGLDLNEIESDTYDTVMSTIAIQHICCHSVRYRLFEEFYRVLKPGGYITIQMGYWGDNPNHPMSACKMCRLSAQRKGILDWEWHAAKNCSHPTVVDYYENYYDAPNTNGAHDTKVSEPAELEKDLTKIKFKDFEFKIRKTGPWDVRHPKWIFFRAWKRK
jgi:ubiquinone/menaquinone biosynthesis C-methylase UbiE